VATQSLSANREEVVGKYRSRAGPEAVEFRRRHLSQVAMQSLLASRGVVVEGKYRSRAGPEAVEFRRRHLNQVAMQSLVANQGVVVESFRSLAGL